MAKYKVLVGLDYSGKRAEPGVVVDDLPAKSIKWLREQGLIVLVSGKEDVEVEEVASADSDKDDEKAEK